MVFTLLLIGVCLILSAAFSGLETALFSLTSLQRLRLKEVGGIAGIVSKVLEKPRKFLMVLLFGNELVNVLISILAASLAYSFFNGYPVRTVYLVSTIATTLVILIFGEIVPKNIAIRIPALVAQTLVVPYLLVSWIVYPFQVLFTLFADWIVQLFGADPSKGRRLIVEEELRNILEHGKKAGTLADLERRLIQNALDFPNLNLFQMMTQREKIVAISVNTPLPEILETLSKKHYSRVPVYEKDLNHMVGILHAKELLPYRLEPESHFNLRSLLKPHFEVSPDETLDHVFQKFQQKRVHMAIVRDKAHKVIGLITMEDLLRRFFL